MTTDYIRHPHQENAALSTFLEGDTFWFIDRADGSQGQYKHRADRLLLTADDPLYLSTSQPLVLE